MLYYKSEVIIGLDFFFFVSNLLLGDLDNVLRRQKVALVLQVHAADAHVVSRDRHVL